MLLGSFFFLLSLGYGALAACNAHGTPPGAAVGTYYAGQQHNGLVLILGGEVEVTYSPPSPGTRSGVVKIVNGASTTRWVWLRDQDTGTYMRFRVDAQKQCKTNLALLRMEGAIMWVPPA